ncbi:MAG: hypothetical protein LBO20_04875, partial [Bifidobacteriaceae bacterium]|nr:hypothetical protein [Bifidobacteriaceae bacterium]
RLGLEPGATVLAAVDAKRREIYWALYRVDRIALAGPPDSGGDGDPVDRIGGAARLDIVGRGAAAVPAGLAGPLGQPQPADPAGRIDAANQLANREHTESEGWGHLGYPTGLGRHIDLIGGGLALVRLEGPVVSAAAEAPVASVAAGPAAAQRSGVFKRPPTESPFAGEAPGPGVGEPLTAGAPAGAGSWTVDPVVLARLAAARAARGAEVSTEPLYLRRPHVQMSAGPRGSNPSRPSKGSGL